MARVTEDIEVGFFNEEETLEDIILRRLTVGDNNSGDDGDDRDYDGGEDGGDDDDNGDGNDGGDDRDDEDNGDDDDDKHDDDDGDDGDDGGDDYKVNHMIFNGTKVTQQ